MSDFVDKWSELKKLKDEIIQEKRLNYVKNRLLLEKTDTEPVAATMSSVEMEAKNRDEVLNAIEEQMKSVLDSVSKENPPFLQYSNRRKWTNAQFDPDLGVQLAEDCTCSCVKFDSIQSVNKFALTLKLLSLIYKLVQSNRYATKRDIYYQNPSAFGSQGCVDQMVENISCMLKVPRNRLHVLATSKGYIAGDLDYTEHDDNHVDCRGTSAGVLVPQHVNGLKNIHSDAKVVMVIEKDATFQRLLDDGVLATLQPCIMITGKGVPDVNTRMMVRKLWETLEIPTLALVDADPHGIEIMSVYKYGSLSMCHDADNLTLPSLRWLGIHPTDLDRLLIPQEALLDLTKTDKEKAESLLSRPYVKRQPLWKEQIERLLALGKKAEIQCLTALSPTYLADVYLPNKIKYGGWI